MGEKLTSCTRGTGENSLSNYAMHKSPPDQRDIFSTPKKGYWSNNKPYKSVIPHDLTFCSPSNYRNELSTPPVRNFNKTRKNTHIGHNPKRISGIIKTPGDASSILDNLDLINSLEEDQSNLKLKHLISPAQLLSGMRSSRAPLKLRRKPTTQVYLPSDLIPSDHRNQLSTPPVRKPNKKKEYRPIHQIPAKISGVNMISRGAFSISDSLDLIDSLEKDLSDLNESNYFFSLAQPLSGVNSTRAQMKLLPKPRTGLLAK